jgi:hypothetical protein
MRSLFIPAVAAAFLATIPLALASDMASGTIKNFSLKTHNLTLDNGTTYTLPNTFKDPGLKVGEKVHVSWQMKDGKHMADSVTVVK